MKKIVSLLLCLAMTVLLLVSCAEEEIGAYRKNYTYEPPTVEDVTLEMYIVEGVGDKHSDENGLVVVSRAINQYTESTFNTTLNIHYLSEAEYRTEVDKVLTENAKFAIAYATLTQALATAKSDESADEELASALPEIEKAVAKVAANAKNAQNEAIQTTLAKIVKDPAVLSDLAGNRTIDILLVNSANMMEGLEAGHQLLDLTDYYSSKEYGTLNTRISSLLLDAAKYTDEAGASKCYAVPNNHMAGSYDYLLVKKEKGKEYLYSPDDLAKFTSYDETAKLREKILTHEGITEEALKEYVRVEKNGTYADRDTYAAKGYVCNTIAYHVPERADVYDASAFAIAATSMKPDRAMEIVYAINQDETLRNLIQYGVANVNYTIADGTITRITTAGNAYYMNPYYTGNIFNAYYSSDPGDRWNAEIARYARLQNDDIADYIKHNPVS